MGSTFTQGAEQDLEDIYDYLARSDPEYANSLLEGLLEMVETLSTFPPPAAVIPRNCLP